MKMVIWRDWKIRVLTMFLTMSLCLARTLFPSCPDLFRVSTPWCKSMRKVEALVEEVRSYWTRSQT